VEDDKQAGWGDLREVGGERKKQVWENKLAKKWVGNKIG